MRKRIAGIVLICMMVLSACGGEKTEEKKQSIQVEEKQTRYELKELSLPESLMTENAQGSDYIGDDFSGFVCDLQGGPAIYYSNFSIENDEYNASITRWSLDEKKNWESEELCEYSLSEFLNQKYEQVSWIRCRLQDFRRGDNGSLYAVFVYYVKQDVVVEEETTEMIAEKYSVLEIDEENDSLYEIPLEIGPPPKQDRGGEWETAVEWISDYHVFEDGSVLILSSDNGGNYGYLIDGESGQVSEEVGNIVTGKRRFAFGESEILFFSKNSNCFEVLGMPDLQKDNTFGSELGEDVLGKDWYFYVNSDTWEAFMCNTSGVYKAVNYQNSDEVECLTEKTDMDELSNGNSDILDFFVGPEEEFYICMVETVEEYGVEERQFRIVEYEKEEKDT